MMSYEDFYGLKEEPFAITPDPKYFYESEQHMGGLTRVQESIYLSKGLSVIIGDMGLGKTFLSRKILQKLQAAKDKYDVSLLVIIHHEITAAWLIKRIALSLGVENPVEDKEGLISQICGQLLKIDEAGKKSVLLIDEAHMFQLKEIYEEIRELINVKCCGRKLLNIVLFGPPELEKYLALDPLLVSEIGLKYIIRPLDLEGTKGYINYRLKVAGAGSDIFTSEACTEVFAYSRGVPRLINAICDNALLEGLLAKKESITPEIIEVVAVTLGLKK